MKIMNRDIQTSNIESEDTRLIPNLVANKSYHHPDNVMKNNDEDFLLLPYFVLLWRLRYNNK